mmetsp:Transcript_25736/g.54613  ORF Transcript_25736/g.54613 Transcript_25736/m.54613 type:complete len:140 (-) Transcript_25736:189-608(-)
MDWPPQQMDYNTKGFERYHHMVQYAQPNENKNVKVCRCWQSKRFPYCDDTHKVMIEAGDNVGPFVAKIQGSSTTSNVSANALQMRNRMPRQAAFFTLGFCSVGALMAASLGRRHSEGSGLDWVRSIVQAPPTISLSASY